jgi:hypothetical protein
VMTSPPTVGTCTPSLPVARTAWSANRSGQGIVTAGYDNGAKDYPHINHTLACDKAQQLASGDASHPASAAGALVRILPGELDRVLSCRSAARRARRSLLTPAPTPLRVIPAVKVSRGPRISSVRQACPYTGGMRGVRRVRELSCRRSRPL